MYGWYSKEAFQTNKIGYIYSNMNDLFKLCTIVSNTDICPYYQPLNIYKENVVFVGELKELICPIHYRGGNDKDKIENMFNDSKKYELLQQSFKTERLLKLRS